MIPMCISPLTTDAGHLFMGQRVKHRSGMAKWTLPKDCYWKGFQKSLIRTTGGLSQSLRANRQRVVGWGLPERLKEVQWAKHGDQ